MKFRTLSLLTLSALFTVLLQSTTTAAETSNSTDLNSGPGFKGLRGNSGHRQQLGRLGLDPEMDIEKLDSNGDKKISLEEFLSPRLTHLDELFTHLDKNGDGLIAPDEVKSQRPPVDKKNVQRAHRLETQQAEKSAVLQCVQQTLPGFGPGNRPNHETLAELFDSADSNGDGKLSLAEVSTIITSKAQAHFSQLDINADGFIDASEIQALKIKREEMAKAVKDCVRAQR